MRLSFITPNRKFFLSAIVQSWIACFIASTLVIAIVWFLLGWQIERFLQSSNQIHQKIKQEETQQGRLNEELSFIELQLRRIQETQKENASLVNAVKNTFELFPEQITIRSISFTQETLIIEGITPTKELYTFLLDPSLKASFAESRVDFFILPSGWYNFYSVNRVTSQGGR